MNMRNDIVARRSLADVIAEKLRERITSGAMKPGDKIPVEPDLMKMFGVGRSSVREAVKLLVTAGLLRVQQGSGTYVQELTAIQEPFAQRLKRSAYADLDEVRSLLEIKIAEKAALNRTAADIARMRKALKQRNNAAIAGDLHASVEADVAFHTAVADACGNEILADLYRSLAVQLKSWFLKVFTDTNEFCKTAPLHNAILDSIVAGDAKTAWNNAQALHGRFL